MNYQTLAAMILRHAATGVAGFLITHGYVENGTSKEQIIGAIMLAGSVAWSWWKNSGQAKAVAFWQTIAVKAAREPASNLNTPSDVAHSVTPTRNFDEIRKMIDAGARKTVPVLLFVLMIGPALSQTPAPSSCDPTVIFAKVASPSDFIKRIRSCGIDDLQAALDDAKSDPVDNGAIACLQPALKFAQSVSNYKGAVNSFQAFRRAKQSGFVGNCISYVNTTILLQ
jgi:hypothetical protein